MTTASTIESIIESVQKNGYGIVRNAYPKEHTVRAIELLNELKEESDKLSPPSVLTASPIHVVYGTESPRPHPV